MVYQCGSLAEASRAAVDAEARGDCYEGKSNWQRWTMTGHVRDQQKDAKGLEQGLKLPDEGLKSLAIVGDCQ